MATSPIPEPVDPIDEEAERFFAHPLVQAAIREHKAWEEAGMPGAMSLEEVAAELGLKMPDLD